MVSRNMYVQGTDEFKHHIATYGPHRAFGYKDFIPQLTGVQFDPDAWAELFRKAGARYVIPVAEHHEGFAMSNNSSLTERFPKRSKRFYWKSARGWTLTVKQFMAQRPLENFR